MESKRFIKTKAINVNNRLVPFWELNYHKSDQFGESFREKDSYKDLYDDLIEVVWDCKKKVFLPFTIKDKYSQNYSVGDTVLVEVQHNSYKLDRIVKIDFNKYESTFRKVKKLDSYEKKQFTDAELAELSLDEVVEFREWLASYTLESGEVIDWDYKLKKLIKSDAES